VTHPPVSKEFIDLHTPNTSFHGAAIFFTLVREKLSSIRFQHSIYVVFASCRTLWRDTTVNMSY
jgi:hypothetical protein